MAETQATVEVASICGGTLLDRLFRPLQSLLPSFAKDFLKYYVVTIPELSTQLNRNVIVMRRESMQLWHCDLMKGHKFSSPGVDEW